MSIFDDPIEHAAYVGRQHRERAALESRHKDEQTQRQQVEILTAAIKAGIQIAPDMFVGLDPRRAAELVVSELMR